MTRDPMPPPAAKADEYRTDGTWGEQTITGLVADHAQLHPGRPAATDQHRSLDYGGLWRRAREAAAGFTIDGVAAGERVLLHLPNSVAWLECLLGLIEAGAVPVMSTESLRASELIEQARAVGASHLLTPAEVTFSAMREAAVETVRNLDGALQLHEIPIATGPRSAPGVDAQATSSCRAEDPALIQIGGPRCPDVLPVVRRHEDYLCSVELSNAACALTADAVMLIGIPASHNYTMASPGIMGALLAGAHVVFAPDPTPSTCWPLLAAHGCTHTPLVPSLLVPWLEAAGDDPAAVAGLRVIWVGGAPLDLTLAARVEAGLGVRVQEVYGMAEGLVAYSPLDMDRTSVAEHRLVPMSERDEIRIVDPSSGVDAVLDGEGRSRGELLCRGPYTVAGFLGAPEGACGIFDADGWYHSGDIVEHQMPDAGFGKPRLAVLGSCKPQINRGAEKIFPGRVESVLLRHPQVVEAKLIGVDDEVLGHATRAVVTVVPDETGRYPKTLKLRRFLHEAKLAAYYLPDSFEIHKRPADGEGALGATRRIDKEV